MTFAFKKGLLYRMPTFFGPSLGPRQGPDNTRFDGPVQELEVYSVRFRSDPDQLDALLPEGFNLFGEPNVTVNAMYMTGVEWLAGRGYNMLSVEIPAEFVGEKDHVRGPFQLVIWENLADPIITGREDVGFSKIYGEIPPPRFRPNLTHCSAGWLGFRFMDMKIHDLVDAPADESEPQHDGTLHLKYIPRTEDWGQADVNYPVLMTREANGKNVKLVERKIGRGSVTFHHAEWEDLPTFYPVVNTLAALKQHEVINATKTRTVGTSPDFYRQDNVSPARILR
ncbi:MAG: acetoacetate decarboxylase family protein [Rhizobiaceae bacterium]